MTKKKKIVIGVSAGVAALVVIALATFFIIRAIFFRPINNQNPFTGDGSEHTVTFDSRGGDDVPTARVRDGNPVRRPETPVRDGYFLIGWFEDTELDDEWDFDKDRVKKDITLYAGWLENVDVKPTASLTYKRDSDGYTVTGVGEDTVLVIPSEYEGSPVTRIGESAFARKAVTEVTVPASVASIELNAFNNCSALETLHISEDSALTEIGRNAFSGCGALGDVYIPSGVTVIGDSAFNNCGSIDFAVAADNSVYRAENGHLIDRATDTLIRGGQSGAIPNGIIAIAQAAFRNATGATELAIPASVETIGNYFVSGSAITVIKYAGSEEMWNAIEKGRMWNSGNRDVSVEFMQ